VVIPNIFQPIGDNGMPEGTVVLFGFVAEIGECEAQHPLVRRRDDRLIG
jgi:hypothetical protein